jgi:hypothetical protein
MAIGSDNVRSMDIRNAWLNNLETDPAADESHGNLFFWFFSYYLPPGSAGGA